MDGKRIFLMDREPSVAAVWIYGMLPLERDKRVWLSPAPGSAAGGRLVPHWAARALLAPRWDFGSCERRLPASSNFSLLLSLLMPRAGWEAAKK